MLRTRTLPLLIVALLAGAALAGCTLPGTGGGTTSTSTSTTTTTSPTDETTTTTTTTTSTTPPPPVVDANTWTVTTAGLPTQAKVGVPVNVSVTVAGTLARNLDHVGAHFANNSTTTPLDASAMKTCVHKALGVPGVLNTTCTFAQTGTWYVYGHARANESGTLFNYWATPTAVKVRNYSLNLSGAPATPTPSNQTFTVTLTVNGTENLTGDVNVYYSDKSTSDPQLGSGQGACGAAKNAPVVDTFTISCKIHESDAGQFTFYLHGYLALKDGNTLEWWSNEASLTIVGVPVTSPI